MVSKHKWCGTKSFFFLNVITLRINSYLEIANSVARFIYVTLRRLLIVECYITSPIVILLTIFNATLYIYIYIIIFETGTANTSDKQVNAFNY